MLNIYLFMADFTAFSAKIDNHALRQQCVHMCRCRNVYIEYKLGVAVRDFSRSCHTQYVVSQPTWGQPVTPQYKGVIQRKHRDVIGNMKENSPRASSRSHQAISRVY